MKKNSKRILSRIMASVMLVSTMLTNVAYANTTEDVVLGNDVAVSDVVLSSSSSDVVVEEPVEEPVEVFATYPSEPVAGEDYFFDFTDGSIIPTDTDGKSDIDLGIIKVLVGTQNAYGYNGTQHGSVLKAGNSIELKVAGSGTVKIGGCAYSNTGDITVSSADGSYSDTRTVEKGSVGCYHNDNSTIDFAYCGDATTLTIEFGTTTYVPSISFVAQKLGKDATEAEKNVSYFFDLTDGSIIPTDTDGKSDVEAGLMKVLVGTQNAYGYNGAQHGSILKGGNSIELKVAGNSYIKFGGCQYSGGTITATSTVGQFEEDSKSATTSACYHNDSTATVDFLYVGEADTLTFTFEGTNYIPNVQIVPVPYDVDLVAWVQKDFSLDVNGTTISVTGAATSGDNSQVTLSDENAEVMLAGTTDASVRINLGGATLSDQLISNVTAGYSAAVVDGKIVVTLADATTKPYEYVISVADNSVVVKAEAGQLYSYTFNNGSVVPQDTSVKYSKFITEDGILTMNSPSQFLYYHDASHGLAATTGDSFDMIVAGNAIITFATCQYTAEGYFFEFTDAEGNILGDCDATNISAGACGSNTFAYAGAAGVITATIKHTEDASGEVYIHGLSIANEAEIVKSDKIDVWDFGGAELDTEIYNNNLTVDVINGLYDSSIEVGSTGVVAPTSFTAGALSWVGGSNDRIRTTNTAITRYDANVASVTTIGDAEVTGRLYVNKAADSSRAISIACAADDIVTVYGKTDSGGKLNFVYAADPEHQTDVVDFALDADVYTFYAKVDGTYKLYDTAGKPSYYRITKQAASYATVSGAVTTPESIPSDYGIIATNTETGKKVCAALENGVYSLDLATGFNYKFSLTDANGYVIETGADVKVENTEDINNPITIVQVPLFDLSGNVTGLDSVAGLTIDLVATSENAIYVPSVTINEDGTYTSALEEGMEYKVVANGVNDYTVAPETIKITENTTMDLAFTAKPVYDVTINVVGEDVDAATLDAVKANLSLTFTNLNEDGYVYSFAAGETPKLRTGVYTVSVAGYNQYAVTPALISNVKVEDAATAKTITFRAVNSWSFSNLNETLAAEGAHEGLVITGAAKTETGKSHLATVAGDEIKVPVKAGETVTITYYYKADFSIDGVPAVEAYNSGSTSVYDSYTTAAAAEDGYMTILVNSTTYFTGIAIGGSVEYKEEITVGADKEFKTINAALDAVRAMARPNNERVKIVIDPGNYEEMLVIDVANVSFVNAAGSASSIELTNKGVDIADNAVRITSYYGHGYNYYSMTTDCKYSDEVLQVNKENGYLSFENPGSGTTKNSYWNATVTVRGEGFIAENIIFENSFNQYISQKEANDVVVEWEAGGKGTRPTTYGDTSVQNKSFVERAAAIAILADKGIYDNCKFVGRQDTLYGAVNCRAYFKNGVAMGGTDYIFGGMIAVFDGTKLMINTSDTSSDVSYITAAQQSSGRGYLMYNCTITSTTPGVDTASEHRAKAFANYLGRPWQATTSETVFYNTVIEAGYTATSGVLGDVDGNGIITANDSAVVLQYVLNPAFDTEGRYNFDVADVDGIAGITASDSALILQKALRSTTKFVEAENSLINGKGWLETLGGKAPTYEYGTIQLGATDGVARADWSTTLEEPKLPDGTEISINNWLGDWDYTADLTVPEPPVELNETTVYVVGDSTGCDYAATADSNYYYKRVGFGTRLGDYLDDKATVVNYALSGRSSKSFTTEANYTALKNNMKEGDYLIIAFGHNDEKSDDTARYTEPMGDKDTAGSFKNSLYVNYIQPALAVGATPILCTPTVRRTDSGSWSDNQLHVANGKSYAECVRELGAELGLTVVDNTADTKALYDELTPNESIYLHAWLNSNKGVDNTHLNNYGAAYVAYLMASSIKNSTNSLSAYVGNITAPDKATELIVNPEYVEPSGDDIEGDALISKYWTTTSPFYGTAFGDIGGQSKLNTVTYAEDGVTVVSDELTINDSTNDTNFAIKELSENSVQIRTGNVEANASFGKIAGTTDAFTLYYIPVDASSNFELSATANVNAVLANNSQTSFGAICLDTIEVDTNNKRTYDYVAAGAVKYGAKDAETGAGATYLTFARDAASNTLSTNVKGEYAPAAGDTVDVKITKVGDKIIATYGNTTSTYDKAMSGKMYIGLYTTRNADVTFTNITYSNEVTE